MEIMKVLANLLLLVSVASGTWAFQPARVTSVVMHRHSVQRKAPKHSQQRQESITALALSQNNNEKEEYSRVIRLREEAESPFRKVRFFFYVAGAGSAMTGLLVSVSRIAAAASGINQDLMQQSLINAGVDLVALAVIFVLWKRDVAAQESRLKRAAKGAELAKLSIKASPNLVGVDGGLTTLSSLRSGRGIEKRVVIAAAGNEKIQNVLKEAESLQDSLNFNDLVVAPVVMPLGVAPVLENNEDMPDCVALPVGKNWKSLVQDEANEANEQGVDVNKEGICIILKKNGRVGQRTRGIYLDNMVGEVMQRREAGMDVSNI